jgi:hypothetical protein
LLFLPGKYCKISKILKKFNRRYTEQTDQATTTYKETNREGEEGKKGGFEPWFFLPVFF